MRQKIQQLSSFAMSFSRVFLIVCELVSPLAVTGQGRLSSEMPALNQLYGADHL